MCVHRDKVIGYGVQRASAHLAPIHPPYSLHFTLLQYNGIDINIPHHYIDLYKLVILVFAVMKHKRLCCLENVNELVLLKFEA